MTEMQSSTEGRLWTPYGFAEDTWRVGGEDDGSGKRILSLTDYLALDRQFRADAADRLAVVLEPAEPVEEIADHLKRLPLVALSFPAFGDGRSYSKAELLRGRYGYGGVLRAVGEVLIDQIPHMLRTGFDEFVVSDATTLARLAEGRLGGLPQHYQPAATQAADEGTYAWRRLSA